MPEEDKQDLVDIDTSGPGAEVQLEEEKIKEVEETKVEEVKKEEEVKVEEPKVDRETRS
jgi:5-hydroxyisourate hydrolase-like protein (transthyretin family)